MDKEFCNSALMRKESRAEQNDVVPFESLEFQSISILDISQSGILLGKEK